MTLAGFRDLFVLTLRDPAAAMGFLRGMNLPLSARWMLLVLTVCISVLIAMLTLTLFGLQEEDAVARLIQRPLFFAGLQVGILAVMAAMLNGIGRAFGGTGNFPDALLAVTWIQIVLLIIQVLRTILAVLLPFTAVPLAFAAIVLSVGLFILFAKALHGFRSTVAVALGLTATFAASILALGLIAAILGIAPEVPA